MRISDWSSDVCSSDLMTTRATTPSGGWRRSRRRCARARSTGYPERAQHYLSGFVLNPEDADQWRAIEAAADAARGRVAETFVWALPQVMRDGFTHDRKSVAEGKSGSVRGDSGGRRNVKKKTYTRT